MTNLSFHVKKLYERMLLAYERVSARAQAGMPQAGMPLATRARPGMRLTRRPLEQPGIVMAVRWLHPLPGADFIQSHLGAQHSLKARRMLTWRLVMHARSCVAPPIVAPPICCSPAPARCDHPHPQHPAQPKAGRPEGAQREAHPLPPSTCGIR